MKPTALLVLVLGALAVEAQSQETPRTLSVDAFLGLDRVSDPQFAPDGQWIAFTVTTTDLGAN